MERADSAPAATTLTSPTAMSHVPLAHGAGCTTDVNPQASSRRAPVVIAGSSDPTGLDAGVLSAQAATATHIGKFSIKVGKAARGGQKSTKTTGWSAPSGGVVRGYFKGARAFRSPTLAGVNWSRVLCRITRDAATGEVLERLYPQASGVDEHTANSRLPRCTDLDVYVHFYDEDIRGRFISPPRTSGRRVRWGETVAVDGDCEILGDGVFQRPAEQPPTEEFAERFAPPTLRPVCRSASTSSPQGEVQADKQRQARPGEEGRRSDRRDARADGTTTSKIQSDARAAFGPQSSCLSNQTQFF